MVLVIALLIAVQVATVTCQKTFPCDFNPICSCETVPGISDLKVSCDNVDTFPDLSKYNKDFKLEALTVTGTYIEIPSNALYPLGDLSKAVLTFYRPIFSSTPLIVHPDSFSTTTSNYIQEIIFNNLNVTSSIIQAVNPVPIYILEIIKSWMGTLPDNYFSGTTILNALHLSGNNISTVGPNWARGLTVNDSVQEMGHAISSLYMENNSISVLESNVFNVNFQALYLGHNQISEVHDYAFSCSEGLSCTNNKTTRIYLSHNPISSISDNAFGNLPKLKNVQLVNCGLTEIPIQQLSVLKNVLPYAEIGLENNSFTAVPANILNGFRLLSFPFNSNPITQIQYGAFNGFWAAEKGMYFQNLPLTYLDLSVLNGMLNLEYFAIDGCPLLTTVDLSDASKLPSTMIQVSLQSLTTPGYENNFQNLSPNFNDWLALSIFKVIILDGNTQYNCTSDIAWMAKYVFCKPQQISVKKTMCSSKVTLQSYLENFQYTCNT